MSVVSTSPPIPTWFLVEFVQRHWRPSNKFQELLLRENYPFRPFQTFSPVLVVWGLVDEDLLGQSLGLGCPIRFKRRKKIQEIPFWGDFEHHSKKWFCVRKFLSTLWFETCNFWTLPRRAWLSSSSPFLTVFFKVVFQLRQWMGLFLVLKNLEICVMVVVGLIDKQVQEDAWLRALGQCVLIKFTTHMAKLREPWRTSLWLSGQKQRGNESRKEKEREREWIWRIFTQSWSSVTFFFTPWIQWWLDLLKGAC